MIPRDFEVAQSAFVRAQVMEQCVPLAGLAGKYDNALLAILQNCVKLPVFLDAIFSFLARRTDFYVLMHHERAKMGFPPGVAESMVATAYKKYEVLTRKREAEIMREEQTKQVEAMTAPPPPQPQAQATTTTQKQPKQKKKKKKSKSPEPIDELPISLPGGTSSSPSHSPPLSPTATTVSSEESPEVEKKDSTAEPEKPKGMKKEKGKGKEKPSDLLSDTFNGAVMENYKWSQTVTDLDVRVPVPPGTKPRDVKVEIRNDYLRVELLRPEKKVVIDKPLLHKIKVEESMWSIDKANNYLTINLEKTKEIMWKSVLEGEEGIDLSKVDTTRDISEFDPECQVAIQRVSYDHRMKMMGQPTSQEKKAHEILRKAWNAEGSPFKGTPFDPSRVQISGQW